MSKLPPIGFDRRLELEWLDFVLAWVARGKSSEEIRKGLNSLLEDRLAASKSGGNREKTITVLIRLWLNVNPEVQYLRDRALDLLETSSKEQRIALHWVMSLANYPFFGDVAQGLGRLFNLQDSIVLSSLKKRIVEKWGDRSNVNNSARRIANSLEQWGLLRSEKRGTFLPPTEKTTILGEHALLLTEALLISGSRDALSLDEITDHPAFFPFSLLVDSESFRTSSRFDVYRQGNHNMVELSQKAKA